MNLEAIEGAREQHPVDMIERVASHNSWSFERTGDDELSVVVTGGWSDYHVSFSWMEDFEALHLSCAFIIDVPEHRALEVIRLMAHVNEQMLFGHFDLWSQEGSIIFRQSLLLAGGAEPTPRQVEMLLSSALDACECYVQAFRFVASSMMSAREALAGVLFETVGSA
ncbi:YbjN domain-containing protein [Mesorhizobium sp. RP14(2022)]|uniref:YbjN domain-containing protein n=1 Tax=Mesorhizobium liriopis TaxID=2953882 RepID=A0ABT1C4X9_9HYPH|nr:YbjN domain-containing protein [Mesorhizobium liriopis]MCO6049864.1 YbjN domain-containing protein [Mesorhizobium liriopis]